MVRFIEIFLAAPDPKTGKLSYLTVTGTNTGPFGNLPASNKPVKFNGKDIVRTKDGKAVERWGVFDNLSMMTQIGMAGDQS
jgi:predicted ester cyclase